MKKLVTFILLLFWTAGLMAQFDFEVSGNITDIANGNPIPDQEVYLTVFDATDSTFVMDDMVMTDDQGHYDYENSLDIPLALLEIGTTDCNGNMVTDYHMISPANSSVTQDFQICTDNGGGGECHANFEYEQGNDFTVDFYNTSEGENLTFYWAFGDGSTSDAENPEHTYPAPGEYAVTLYIATPDSSCFDVYTEMIEVEGGSGECHANFEYEQGNDFTVDFYNTSEGENLIYYWTFGDGFNSSEENPTHTYLQGGEYLVTLYIATNDSSCFDVHEEMVNVEGGSGECHAYFEYEQEDAYTFSFINESEGDNLVYFWSFGDNTYSQEENPVHTYETDGYYLVNLMVTNEDSTCFDFYEDMVIAGDSVPGECQASFSYEYDQENPAHVFFTDMSIGEDGNSPDSWMWDFGDGNFSTEQNPDHTYEGSGIYNVCLAIMSADSNCYDVYCEPVLIEDSLGTCVAQFTYYPDSSESDNTYQFVDLSYGSDIQSWYWDFGDGTFSSEQNPVHTFPEEGDYYVCLTIQSEDCESVWCEDVYAGEFQDCYNYFTYESVGTSVLFEGFHSTDGEVSYSWEFGDGNSGEGQTTDHTYETTGTYFVTLTSVDEDSCVATSSQVIVVGDSIMYHQVYGQVFEGNFPLVDGLVMIFSADAGPNYEPYFDATMIDSSGVYVFPYVPNGEFYVYAIPLNWNGYIPTYYGDVINWDDATTIVLGEPDNPYDIHLVPAEGMTDPGNGNIDGAISNNVRSNFVDKIQMLLYNQDHEVIGFTDVDENGMFNFSNLAMGTYYLYAELSGTTSDLLKVVLTAEQQNASVNMTMSGSSILGTKETHINTEIGKIYPNPVNKTAKIELTNQKETKVNVTLVDITGRTQYRKEYDLHAGSSVINIPMEHLVKGMYIVRLSNTEGDIITRKVIHD